ncbi:MAG: hypothetical protein HZC29_01905 [Thaumarchaeota archaeon]|nr:hypothetical protein [Nitrososphaerota archaeon]
MSSDMNRFIDDLDKAITEILTSLRDNKPITIHQKKSSMGFDITTNISVRLGLLESLGTPKYEQAKKEPAIEVIEGKHDVRIIAIIPGIKTEDIKTSIHDGFIEIKITRENQLFHRKISCNIKPDQFRTKSLNYNNSVLEIIFSKETNYASTI